MFVMEECCICFEVVTKCLSIIMHTTFSVVFLDPRTNSEILRLQVLTLLASMKVTVLRTQRRVILLM
jgi:hypothetical protein